MRVHQGLAAGLVCSLGLVAWGCSGESVESGVKSTGDGIKNTGKAIENAGEKLKDKAADIGKAVDKKIESAKELEEKAVQKIKDGAKATVEGAKNVKDKIVDEGKALKDKATGATDSATTPKKD
jgi:hypothetical protein